MNVRDIARKAELFRASMKSAKTPQNFEWYRYDSLSNWIHIEQLLTGANRELAEGGRVLDVGCADGDVAFFLESLGYEVTVVDYPPTNHNSMAGVRKLKEVLGSRVEILAMDVDSQFAMPEREFELALVLGAVYHLKNPLYLMEAVSKCAARMLVSTRVAKHLPRVTDPVRDVPVAYLLGDDELNSDNSNYWIFSEAGFRRMLSRTNWEVLDAKTFGDTRASDPVHAEHDERMFCYARSHYALANVELLYGWHAAEGDGWRWTEQRFALRVLEGTALKMKLYVPPELLERWGSLTLASNAGPALRFEEAGDHVAIFAAKTAVMEFAVDRAVPGDSADRRERGVVVHSIDVVS